MKTARAGRAVQTSVAESAADYVVFGSGVP